MNDHTKNTSSPGLSALSDVASSLNISLIALGFVALSSVGFTHLVNSDVQVLTVGATVVKEAESQGLVQSEDVWTLAPHPVLDKVDHLALGEGLKPTTPVKQGLKASSSALGLSDEMGRVRDWVSKRYRVSGRMLEPALVAVQEHAQEAGLDPLLIVAVMAIESSFDPKAESHAGAQGLMQVIPRWHMDKIGEGASEDALFDPVINVRVGTQVLVEGLQRYGSLQAALQYYNGARNDPNARYTKRVLAMKEQLVQVAREDNDA